MVEDGYADAVLYEPNDLYWNEFSDAADAAQAQDVGLWGECQSFGAQLVAENESAPEPEPETVMPEEDTAPAGDCDPSYPGVCMPPAPPDLNCGEISERRFEVVGSDPHGFDGDDDGVGCES